MFNAAISDSELSLCNYCIVHNCPVDIIRDLMSDPLMLMLFGTLTFRKLTLFVILFDEGTTSSGKGYFWSKYLLLCDFGLS